MTIFIGYTGTYCTLPMHKPATLTAETISCVMNMVGSRNVICGNSTQSVMDTSLDYFTQTCCINTTF